MNQQHNISTPNPAELARLLDFQDCLKVPRTAYERARTCLEKGNFFRLVCDLYNLGYIMGRRAERQRRKPQKSK